LVYRAGVQRSAEKKWSQDAAWQTYKRLVPTSTSPLAPLKRIIQENPCVLAIFVEEVN
jgi:hypothetical protein